MVGGADRETPYPQTTRSCDVSTPRNGLNMRENGLIRLICNLSQEREGRQKRGEKINRAGTQSGLRLPEAKTGRRLARLRIDGK